MSDTLLDLLDLTRVGPDSYRGREAPEAGGLMFGGQLLAQALMAASATTTADRHAHSVHAYFLRAGSVDDPVDIAVERIRDGRSFSTRESRISQNGREIFRATVSFHAPESGLSWAPPSSLPDQLPDDVETTYSQFIAASAPDEKWFGEVRPIDIRYINAPTEPEGVPVTEPQLMWIRIADVLPADASIHTAALAYLADATLVDHVLLPHGQRWQDPRLTGASLDHAMWFHSPARADEWMLYDQRVEYTGGARGLASATLLSSSGSVVATCVQEGLMRWTPQS